MYLMLDKDRKLYCNPQKHIIKFHIPLAWNEK